MQASSQSTMMWDACGEETIWEHGLHLPLLGNVGDAPMQNSRTRQSSVLSHLDIVRVGGRLGYGVGRGGAVGVEGELCHVE